MAKNWRYPYTLDTNRLTPMLLTNNAKNLVAIAIVAYTGRGLLAYMPANELHAGFGSDTHFHFWLEVGHLKLLETVPRLHV